MDYPTEEGKVRSSKLALIKVNSLCNAVRDIKGIKIQAVSLILTHIKI